MSGLSGKVGKWEIQWLETPRGQSGAGRVRLNGETIEVRWRKDAHGIWIEARDRVRGFDISAQNEEGTLQYRLSERSGDRLWEGLRFQGAGEEAAQAAAAGAKKGARVRSQMPGKIVRILVKAGDQVEKDQPLLVMEAMKMENEIKAPIAGKVKEIKVSEGQAVETGADLALLE